MFFNKIGKNLVRVFLKGGNLLILSKYEDLFGSTEDPGLITRVLDSIFKTLGKQIANFMPVKPTMDNRVTGYGNGKQLRSPVTLYQRLRIVRESEESNRVKEMLSNLKN